jgi:hypothetical protein
LCDDEEEPIDDDKELTRGFYIAQSIHKLSLNAQTHRALKPHGGGAHRGVYFAQTPSLYIVQPPPLSKDKNTQPVYCIAASTLHRQKCPRNKLPNTRA